MLKVELVQNGKVIGEPSPEEGGGEGAERLRLRRANGNGSDCTECSAKCCSFCMEVSDAPGTCPNSCVFNADTTADPASCLQPDTTATENTATDNTPLPTPGAVTARIVFKEGFDVDAATAKLNAAITGGLVSLSVTINGKVVTVNVTDTAVLTSVNVEKEGIDTDGSGSARRSVASMVTMLAAAAAAASLL